LEGTVDEAESLRRGSRGDLVAAAFAAPVEVVGSPLASPLLERNGLRIGGELGDRTCFCDRGELSHRFTALGDSSCRALADGLGDWGAAAGSLCHRDEQVGRSGRGGLLGMDDCLVFRVIRLTGLRGLFGSRMDRINAVRLCSHGLLGLQAAGQQLVE